MRHLIRSAGTLVLGTAIAQLVSLVALPVISRIYGPDAYGEFSMYVVWVGLIVILATLQLQHAVMLPKLKKHALSLIRASVGALFLVSFVVLLVAIVILKVWLEHDDALMIAALMAIAIALSGTAQMAQGYAIRAAEYSTVAYASVVRVVVVVALQILFGRYGFGVKGLLLAFAIGEAVALCVTYYALRHHFTRLQASSWRLIQMIAVFKRYRDFAYYGVAQEFLNSASQGLPVLMLGHGYGQASAGAYAATARLLGAPVQLIGNATRQIAYRELALTTKSTAERLRMYIVATLWLLVPAVIIALVAYPWIDDLTLLLLGKKWSLAGEYAPPLALGFAVAMGNSPTTAIFRILRRQEVNLFYNAALFLMRGLVLWIAISYTESNIAIYLFAAIGIVMNLLYMGIGYRLLSSKHESST